MLILTIRTDKPEAELGVYNDEKKIEYFTWPAHRELAETIHTKIHALLYDHNLELHDLGGLILFKGPGSFTGLRIGASVANALADSLGIPIVGTNGDQWISEGQSRLEDNQNNRAVMPEYGAEPHITAPRK